MSDDSFKSYVGSVSNHENMMEKLTQLHELAEEVENDLPPHYSEDMKHIRRAIGGIKSNMNEETPHRLMNAAGKKHSIKMEGEDRLERRPD